MRCVWCQNPESYQRKPEIAFYAEHCRRCFKCLDVCEVGAILENETLRVDYSKCTSCGECVFACVHRGVRKIGQEWDGEVLLEELLKDKDCFVDSGGGITLSGGEPLMQASALAAWLPDVKEYDLHVNLETSGLFGWNQIEGLLPYLDLVYFDLKHMDAKRHKELTGRTNEIILENFTGLCQTPVTLQARMPVIPGMNDDPENIKATAQFLRTHGCKTIHCLPYHKLGESKIPRIDTHMKPLHLEPLSSCDLDGVSQAFEKEGIYADIYD